jgi:nitrogen fixation-related uncharacterized protein
MQSIVIMCVIGAVLVWAWKVADYYTDNKPVESDVDDTWPFPKSKP